MNPAQVLLQRELGRPHKHALHMPPSVASKLALEKVLEGHDGCVNRLAWNEEGTMLASASDDCQVLLWHYPDTERVPLALQTQHRANLFGVQFLPQHNNCRVVTGAMDYTVQLHELDAGAFNISPKYRRSGAASLASPAMRRHQPAPQVHQVVPRTQVFHCHKSRVKEVEICNQEPTMFWSAGEDGTIRQYDTRVPDQKAYGSPNVLVNLASAGPMAGLVECKGVDINPTRPHLMAVAGGDPFVRVYDRRQLSTGRPGGRTSRHLLRLSSPHLPLLLQAGVSRRAHTTHVSFSNRGDKLVASYHGDHAYIFDVTGAADTAPVELKQQRSGLKQQGGFCSYSSICGSSRTGHPNSAAAAAITAAVRSSGELPANIPEAAESAKVAGNNALFAQQYTMAVDSFTAAIASAPWVPGLYTQRALAWLKRGWEGDAMYALRDCEMALTLVSQTRGAGAAAAAAAEQQARLRTVHALKQLGQHQCALAALESYMRYYPHTSDSSELNSLSELLKHEVEQRQAYKARMRQQRELLRQRRRMQASVATAAAVRSAVPSQQQLQAVGPEATTEAGASADQQQQQRAMSYLASTTPTTAAAGSTAGDASDIGQSGSESDGGSSSSMSPIGAPVLHPPPGRGFRIDTDLDSDDLEGAPTAAPVAIERGEAMDVDQVGIEGEGINSESGSDLQTRLTAATEQEDEGFVGPLPPPPPPPPPRPHVTAQAVTGAARSLPLSQHDQADAAAAAAATELTDRTPAAATTIDEHQHGSPAAAGRRVNRVGAAVDESADWENANSDSEDDHEHGWFASADQDNGANGELLMPWYGPSVYAQEQITAGVAAEYDKQQQQQGPGDSSRRRRPRTSGSDGSNAGGSPKRSSPSSGRNGWRQASNSKGDADASANLSGSSSRNLSSCSWWDVLSGGHGRLLCRCIGHCNVQTDIKECVFLGQSDELVGCGSDDGRVFIYDVATGACVRVLPADEDVANCVRCHPTLPVLATSGIDSVVRLWSPLAAPDTSSCDAIVAGNQSRMRDGPRFLRAGLPPAALQAALEDNPQLLHMLMQQLYGMAAGPTAAASGGGTHAVAREGSTGPASATRLERREQGEGLEHEPGFDFEIGPGSDDESDDGEGQGEPGGRRRRRMAQDVACRVS